MQKTDQRPGGIHTARHTNGRTSANQQLPGGLPLPEGSPLNTRGLPTIGRVQAITAARHVEPAAPKVRLPIEETGAALEKMLLKTVGPRGSALSAEIRAGWSKSGSGENINLIYALALPLLPPGSITGFKEIGLSLMAVFKAHDQASLEAALAKVVLRPYLHAMSGAGARKS